MDNFPFLIWSKTIFARIMNFNEAYFRMYCNPLRFTACQISYITSMANSIGHWFFVFCKICEISISGTAVRLRGQILLEYIWILMNHFPAYKCIAHIIEKIKIEMVISIPVLFKWFYQWSATYFVHTWVFFNKIVYFGHWNTSKTYTNYVSRIPYIISMVK